MIAIFRSTGKFRFIASDAGGVALFQSHIRFAGMFILCAAMATTATAHCQRPKKGNDCCGT
jgi:hypothetical protein